MKEKHHKNHENIEEHNYRKEPEHVEYIENNNENYSKSYGIASFALGILSLPFAIIFFPLGIIIAIISIVFFFIQKKTKITGFSIAGLVLGIISLLLCISIIGFGIYFFTTFSNNFESFQNSSIEESVILCNADNNEFESTLCYGTTFGYYINELENKTNSICELQYPIPENRKICYSILALTLENTSICNKLTTINEKEYCMQINSQIN